MPSAVRLEIPATPGCIPIATALAEHAGLDFGLTPQEATELKLAVEEVTVALGSLGVADLELKLEAHNRVYYTEIIISIRYTELRVHKLNLTAASCQDEDFDQLEWVLAARMVDSLTIEHQGKRCTRFRLRKLRSYPPAAGRVPMPLAQAKVAQVRTGVGQDVVLFAQRLLQKGEERLHQWLFDPPLRLAGRIESGEYEALLGYADGQDPIAGLVVERSRPNLAVLYGPYSLTDSPTTQLRLFHALLERLARTAVEGVVIETETLRLPEGDVERLGSRRLRQPNGEPLEVHAFYRTLREDNGSLAWSVPWLDGFLRAEYQRLCLPRDVAPWVRLDEDVAKTPSVLSCQFRQRRSECVLTPVLAGYDTTENLASHLKLLASEGVLNVTFELDLGQSFHLAFAEALEQNGFRPVFVIPMAGKGDLLLFEGELG